MGTQKLEIIQLIRGYAAFSVFLSHFLGDYENSLHLSGQLGVAVFFWISGFLMIYTTYGEVKHYFIKRLIRIVPLYYLMTFFVFLVGQLSPRLLHTAEPTVVNLCKSLLFIPYRVTGTRLIQPILAVGWTLYLEIFVSALFAFGYLVFKSNIKAGIITAIFLLIFLIINQTTGTNLVWVNTYGRAVNLYWVSGILFAMLYEKIKKIEHEDMMPDGWKVAMAVLGLVLFLLLENYYVLCYATSIMISFLLSLIVYLLANIHLPKVCLCLGEISYSFYLIHYFVIKMFSRMVIPKLNYRGGVLVCVVLCGAITLGISLISYELVEKKFTSWLKKRILK